VGEDIGFLPVTEEEKMTPWMGALMDNLEVLYGRQDGGAFGRVATEDLLRNKIITREEIYAKIVYSVKNDKKYIHRDSYLALWLS
jgi:predicted ribonuclease YlaK